MPGTIQLDEATREYFNGCINRPCRPHTRHRP